jgi:hypothetical protein
MTMATSNYHPGQFTHEKNDQLDRNGTLREPHELSGGDFHEEQPDDVFGREDDHDIKYKTLSWPIVAVLMITEIVSNGMLSLPSSLAAVGVVPGVIVIFFLGAFATYTAWALIQFKLRHPEGEWFLV